MANSSKPNQPLVTHIYTADPSAHVFEGKLYIYPSHDLDEVRESNDLGTNTIWRIITFFLWIA